MLRWLGDVHFLYIQSDQIIKGGKNSGAWKFSCQVHTSNNCGVSCWFYPGKLPVLWSYQLQNATHKIIPISRQPSMQWKRSVSTKYIIQNHISNALSPISMFSVTRLFHLEVLQNGTVLYKQSYMKCRILATVSHIWCEQNLSDAPIISNYVIDMSATRRLDVLIAIWW